MRTIFITNGPNQFYREGKDYSFDDILHDFITFIYDNCTDAFFHELRQVVDLGQFASTLKERGYSIFVNGNEVAA